MRVLFEDPFSCPEDYNHDMLRRERTCDCCGKVEFVFTRTDTCHECHWKKKQHVAAETERQKLKDLGYAEIDGPVFQQTLHRSWIFTHECGTRQTWRYGNILKQLKLRPDAVPCKACGGKERIGKAMDAYVEKYGMTEERLKVWKKYRRKVVGLSEVTYQQHLNEINPHGHKRTRGSKGWHLDHKKPIIQCFLDGEPPEHAARLENLEMLPAFDNLSKGRGVESRT